MKRGALIAFEGIEGSGKSTQARLLYESLSELGYECLLVRDPGTTPVGEAIREVLLNRENEGMDPLCELFLYLAGRSQLVRATLEPALKAGKVVITDRFSLSSYAYQVGARGLKPELVSRLDRLATRGIRPDLVILLDLPVATGLSRAGSDRLTREPVEFHSRVRDAYLRSARRASRRIRVFDGERPIDELREEIRSMVIKFLNSKEG